MDVEYGVGITNRFAYLYGSVDKEEEEEVEVVPVAVTKKDGNKAKGAAPAQQQKSKPKQQPSSAVIQPPKQEAGKPALGSGGRGKTPNENAENRKNAANDRNYQQGNERSMGNNRYGEGQGRGGDRDQRRYPPRGRGEPGEGDDRRQNYGTRVYSRGGGSGGGGGGYGPGTGGGRGNRGGRYNDENRNDRDRNWDGRKQHSDHGKKGAMNGPSDNEADPKDNKEPTAADEGKDDKENEKDGDGNQIKNENDKQEEVEEKEEKEVPTFTLTEWKKLQAPREKPQFNTRKPGEGEAKLGKLVPMQKDEEDLAKYQESDDHDFEHEEIVYYPQRAGKQKPITDVGFSTGYQKRRGGGRSGGEGRFDRGDHGGRFRREDGRSPSAEKGMGHGRGQGQAPTDNKPRGGGGRARNQDIREEYRRPRQPSVQAPPINDTAAFPALG